MTPGRELDALVATHRNFPHVGRAGGSYTKHIRYEPGFVVVIDEWDHETIIPSDAIAEIKTEPHQYRW